MSQRYPFTDEALAQEINRNFGSERFTLRTFYRKYHAGIRTDFPDQDELTELRSAFGEHKDIVEHVAGPKGGEGYQLTERGQLLALACPAH